MARRFNIPFKGGPKPSRSSSKPSSRKAGAPWSSKALGRMVSGPSRGGYRR